MSSNRITPYSTINLPREQADGLRRLTRQLAVVLGRRVTHSETMAVLIHIANEDPDALPQALTYIREHRQS